MTGVRPSPRYRIGGHLTFKRVSRLSHGRQARLTNKSRLGEDSRGGRFRPCFPTHVFSRLQRKPIARWLAVGLRSGADVAVRRAVTVSKIMKDTTDSTTTDVQLTEHDLSEHRGPFDAFDGWVFQVSNEESQDGGGELTRLTDLTPTEMGVYVASARPHPHPHPLGLLPAPLTTAVKSVKSVKPQDGEGWFSPPCRQTGCQFDGNAETGVVA